MDSEFLRERKMENKWGAVLVVIGVIVLLFIAVIFLLSGNKEILSPIPPKPDYEVVFETPTNAPVTPSLTPSPTPKGKKAPTVTPKPKASSTPKVSVSEPIKALISPTIKP